jgi:hypothetical protein
VLLFERNLWVSFYAVRNSAQDIICPDKTLPGIRSHKFVFDVPAAARDRGAYLVIIRSPGPVYSNACRTVGMHHMIKKNPLYIYTKKSKNLRSKNKTDKKQDEKIVYLILAGIHVWTVYSLSIYIINSLSYTTVLFNRR